jgi:hypothetical protein
MILASIKEEIKEKTEKTGTNGRVSAVSVC